MTVSETLDGAKGKILEKSEVARIAASDALGSAKAGAGRAVDAAGEALGSARESASGARDKAASAIDANPLAALAGGLALGAIAGALIPRSQRETELLAPVGSLLNEAARNALAAAKEAGRQSLADHGVSGDAAREQVNKLVEAVTKSASAAGGAAAGAVRG